MPALRRARGRVVFMGSIGGRSALPFLGAYAMSKFALEAMADALRVELAPWDVQVSIVEPATIATAMWTKPQRSLEEASPLAAELYGERAERFRRLAAKRSQSAGVPAEAVAKTVERALTAPQPHGRATWSGRMRGAAQRSRSSPTGSAIVSSRASCSDREGALARSYALPARWRSSSPSSGGVGRCSGSCSASS